jgi:hypothetical protein
MARPDATLRTSCARRAIQRRNARVASSGIHTASRNPEASTRAKVRASRRSVLVLASEIWRSFLVLATTTRATCPSTSRAIASAFAVASSAT